MDSRKNQHVKTRPASQMHVKETKQQVIMQMILSAGFPERLLERQSRKAFKILFFFKKQ